MLRVSESTSSFAELPLLNPRELMAQMLDVACATWSPGARRSASGMLVTPERRSSSLLMTAIAAAAPASGSSFLETEVTSTLDSSSRLSVVRSRASSPEALAAISKATNADPRWTLHDFNRANPPNRSNVCAFDHIARLQPGKSGELRAFLG